MGRALHPHAAISIKFTAKNLQDTVALTGIKKNHFANKENVKGVGISHLAISRKSLNWIKEKYFKTDH